MSEIAYEARLVLDRVHERINYHTYQRDKWREAWERANRDADPNGVGFTTSVGHYEHARMYEHIHALLELIQVKAIIELQIEAAKVRARFEARGLGDGTAAGTATWDRDVHPETARKFLIGVRDGDPEMMDEIPSPNVSGEWAGDDTWTDIYCELMEIDPQDM